MPGDDIKARGGGEEWDHMETLFNEKVKRLDDKIDHTERYLAEKCEALRAQILATEKLLVTAQDSAKEAVKIANDSSKIRFESFNEFNTRITQMTATFFTIPAFEQFRNSIDSWKLDVNKRLDWRGGESSGIKLTGSTILSGLVLISLLIGIIVAVAAWGAGKKGP
jgi:thiol:disulfide interchange protein